VSVAIGAKPKMLSTYNTKNTKEFYLSIADENYYNMENQGKPIECWKLTVKKRFRIFFESLLQVKCRFCQK
jgi:hypothetical protein